MKYEFITDNEGLPTNEVYHAFEDESGIMWFGSDEGLIRYSGENLELFSTNEGLPEKTVLRLYNYGKDTIFIECLRNEYAFFYNGQITPYPYNDTLDKYFTSVNFSYSFFLDENGHHHFGSRNGYLVLDRKGNVVKKVLDNTDKRRELVYWTSSDYFFSYELRYSSMVDKGYELRKVKNGNEIASSFVPTSDGLLYLSCYGTKSSDIWFFNKGRNIIIDEADSISFLKVQYDPISISNVDGYLFVGSLNKGLFIYRYADGQLILKENIFPNLSITYAMSSSDGTIWLTTRENGIIKIPFPDLEILFNASEDENISAFYIDSNNVIIGNEQGEIVWNDQRVKICESSIIHLDSLENQSIYFGTRSAFNGNLNIINQNIQQAPKIIDSITGESYASFPFQFTYQNKKILYSEGRVFLYRGFTKESSLIIFFDRITDLSAIEEYFVLSTNKGITFFTKDGFFPTDSILPNESVIGFEKYKGTIYGLTKSGILVNVKNLEQIQLSVPTSNIDYFTDFLIVEDFLYTTCNRGLIKWKFIDNMNLELQSFLDFGRLDEIKTFEDNLLLRGKKVAFSIDPSSLLSTPPKPLLKSLFVNDNSVEINDWNQFEYYENDFEFYFESIGYKSSKRFYKYILTNHNKQWVFTNDNHITFSSLPPGKYQLNVQSSMDGIFFSPTLQYSFTIKKPFWLTLWFIVLCLIVGASLIFFLVKKRIDRIKAMYQIHQTMNKLKMRSLLGQLNPHLMFNALSSIQSMILTQNKEKANSSLVKFSKYLRNTLNLTKSDLVSLDEEIEITKQYIEIEKLRFEESIVFVIKDNTVNNSIKVPPLLLQPLIENAIKHGIGPSELETGVVELILENAGESLRIFVNDNGNGAKNDVSLWNGDGLRICTERIKALNTKNTIEYKRSSSKTSFIITIYS